jgi:hypothetical protein
MLGDLGIVRLSHDGIPGDHAAVATGGNPNRPLLQSVGIGALGEAVRTILALG